MTNVAFHTLVTSLVITSVSVAVWNTVAIELKYRVTFRVVVSTRVDVRLKSLVRSTVAVAVWVVV